MWLKRLISALRHTGYDKHGNVKYLLGRDADPSECLIDGVSNSVRDEALRMLCDSFDIPERQMYCLRLTDDLGNIYRSYVGPRCWDDMEFERLRAAIEQLPGPELTDEMAESVRTVADVIRLVADRSRV